jgi:hypothetical protein
MPVDSVHTDYAFWSPWWQKLEDITGGHPFIKAGGQTYLPKPRAQRAQDYNDYAELATFFNATGRTLNAIIGILFRKPAQPVNIPTSLEDRLEDIDRKGNPLDVFLRTLGREIYKKGRVGVLIDNAEVARAGETPYLTYFTADQIIDWREGRGEDGTIQPLQVRVQDTVHLDGADEFVSEQRKRIRSFEIKDNRYQIREWIADSNGKFPLVGRIVAQPNRQQQPLRSIPFHFFSPFPGAGAMVCPPPLLDIAIENLAHFWATADFENARHVAGSPTLYIADDAYKAQKGPTKLGTHALLKLSTGGVADFAALGAELIAALLEPLRERKQNMAALGLQMIAPQRLQTEAAETHQLRQAGEMATLVDVSMSLGAGMEFLLREMAWWGGEERTVADQVQLDFPMDFVPGMMDPGLFSGLLQAVQEGRISLDTFLWNCSQNEMFPPGRTIEDEKLLIEEDNARLLPNMEPLNLTE